MIENLILPRPPSGLSPKNIFELKFFINLLEILIQFNSRVLLDTLFIGI